MILDLWLTFQPVSLYGFTMFADLFSGEDDPRRNRDDVSTSEDEDIETAQEKRLRIAKEYLLELKTEGL